MPQSGFENMLLATSAKTSPRPLLQEVQSSQATTFSQGSGSTAITSTTNTKERIFSSGQRSFPSLDLACLGNLVLFVWKADRVPVKNSGQGWPSQPFFCGCAGSSLLCAGFLSSYSEWALLSSCALWASHCGFSCCRAQALDTRAQ